MLVLALAVLFINLGFWQLSRLDDRQIENAVGEARFSDEPVELSILLEGAGEDFESLEYRRTFVTGTYLPEDEVLIRSQVELGQAGFHVVTPFMGADVSVLTNRGWVPLVLDQVPVEQAPPEAGVTTASGWLSLGKTRATFGPPDPEDGRLIILNRIDIDRIQQQVPYELAPMVLNLSESSGELPIPVPEPDFENEGPHLAYAIQWFSFTIILVVGYAFLLRRVVRSG